MLTATLLLVLGLVLITLIIVVNGYFVAQEFAYMSVDRSVLRAEAERGDTAAQLALKVTRRTSYMLSGAQLGITVTGLLIGFVAEPLVGEPLAKFFGAAGVPTAVGVTVGTVVALALATVAQMIFAELFPKNLAIAAPAPLARALARSTLIYLAVVGWLITVFDWASNTLLKLLGIEPVHDLDSSATAEDLESIVGDSRSSGDLPGELSMLLDRILDFPQRDVNHAMISRSASGLLTSQNTVAEARRLMAGGHTRYPVIGSEDDPIGVVHLSDVLLCDPDDQRSVTAIMREPLVLAELTRLPDALRSLTESRKELACVIDEHGGFAGVLTVEDLAEELVGEITDEHDPDDIAVIEAVSDDQWRADGTVHLDELERALNKKLPEGEFETLSGLLIATNGGLLEAGDHVEVPLPEAGVDLIADVTVSRSLYATVLEIERHVPSSVSIEVREVSDMAITNREDPSRSGDSEDAGRKGANS
ncbi:MAG: hemolysin family protein [Leucobacter sp.]